MTLNELLKVSGKASEAVLNDSTPRLKNKRRYWTRCVDV